MFQRRHGRRMRGSAREFAELFRSCRERIKRMNFGLDIFPDHSPGNRRRHLSGSDETNTTHKLFSLLSNQFRLDNIASSAEKKSRKRQI